MFRPLMYACLLGRRREAENWSREWEIEPALVFQLWLRFDLFEQELGAEQNREKDRTGKRTQRGGTKGVCVF